MRVLKWPVPVDDQAHMIGHGRVVLVASQEDSDVTGEYGIVNVWTLEGDKDPVPSREVLAVGTGHRLPTWGDWSHVGSCLAGPFVWHVFANEQF